MWPVDTDILAVRSRGELVVEQQEYGWSPEELHFQHPYLTLGQIHLTLAY